MDMKLLNVKTAATNAGIDYVVINSKKMISRNMISGLEKINYI